MSDARSALGDASGVWGHLDSLDRTALGGYARRVEELGYSALWVPDVVGREPFTLAALLAAATDRIAIGTSIVSIWGRGPQAARMASMTLHEATGGRFILGLGVSHAHMAARLHGQEYDRPLQRMRDYLAAYRAARYTGPAGDGGEPPVIVAALRERMLELAARDADGTFAYLVTAERIAWMRRILDAAAVEVTRRPLLAVSLPVVGETDRSRARDVGRAYLAPYLRTANYQASWSAQGFEPADWEKPGSDRLVDAMVAFGDRHALDRRIGDLRAAGADHVAMIPLAADGSTENLALVEFAARVIGPPPPYPLVQG
jgi:probable F420-dependent oxidoreductase